MARGKKGTQDLELTEKTKDEILRVLRMGMSIREACEFAGCSETAFRKWQKVGSTRPPDTVLGEFAVEVPKARTKAKAMALGAVFAGMKKDWKASAWFLGVTYPTQYGPKVRVTLEQEFSNAIANLEEDFGDSPELLGKVLASITRERGGGGDAALGVEEPPLSPGDDSEPA